MFSNEKFIERTEKAGFGKIAKILFEAPIMHIEWEMDAQAWIVEMDDGSIQAFSTNHVRIERWKCQEAKEKLVETLASAEAIRKAMKLMNWSESN